MRKPRDNEIIRAVAHHYGLDPYDINADAGRTRPKMEARQVAAYLLREYRGYSYPQVARAIGYLDHTSAIHSVKRVLSTRRYHLAAFEIEKQICRALLCESEVYAA